VGQRPLHPCVQWWFDCCGQGGILLKLLLKLLLLLSLHIPTCDGASFTHIACLAGVLVGPDGVLLAVVPLSLFQACQAALSMEPQWVEASKELIRALLAAKRHDEAVVKARELLQQHQQDGEIHQVGLVAGGAITNPRVMVGAPQLSDTRHVAEQACTQAGRQACRQKSSTRRKCFNQLVRTCQSNV